MRYIVSSPTAFLLNWFLPITLLLHPFIQQTCVAWHYRMLKSLLRELALCQGGRWANGRDTHRSETSSVREAFAGSCEAATVCREVGRSNFDQALWHWKLTSPLVEKRQFQETGGTWEPSNQDKWDVWPDEEKGSHGALEGYRLREGGRRARGLWFLLGSRLVIVSAVPEPGPGSPGSVFHILSPAAGRGCWDDSEYGKPASRLVGVGRNRRRL